MTRSTPLLTDETWQPDTILLLAHGSRDAQAREELRELCGRLSAHPALAHRRVEYGVLEFAMANTPAIRQTLEHCVREGARRIQLVPLVFFAGGHATNDLPRLVHLAQEALPSVELRLAPLLGIDDLLLQEVAEDAEQRFADLPPVPREQTALLLVTSGSASREANADVYKAARLLADLLPGRLLEVAFLRLSRPYLQHAAARCAALGARQVVVAPLLLNTGLLARRVPRKLRWIREQHPEILFVDLPHLGVRPVVLEVLVRRALGASRAGTAFTPVFLAPGRERCRPVHQDSVTRRRSPADRGSRDA